MLVANPNRTVLAQETIWALTSAVLIELQE